MLAHAIDHADAAEQIDTAIVSTEDEEIRRIAKEAGGSVPFERPAGLATDDATTDEVVAHAIEWYEKRGEQFDVVCAVPVTTPLRTPTDIDAIIETLEETDAKSAMGITEYDSPPFSAVDIEADGIIEPYFEETNLWKETQDQNVPTLYHPNGAAYVATVAAFKQHRSFYTPDTVGHEMPPERSLDIDIPFDLEVARAIMENRQ
jgi:CMP-N-acetylneuraminic acid synthetase